MKRLSVSKEILDVINKHMDKCLETDERSEQNEEFAKLQYPYLTPIKMTPTTAVFLYNKDISFIIKRVIDRPESPTQEDLISIELKQKNVMKTYKTFRTTYHTNDEDKGLIWLINEYLPIRISHKEINRDEKIIRRVARDVLYALKYLHERKIAHLDIKIANIMGCYKNNEIIYKLIDFGFARKLSLDVCSSNNETYIPRKSFGTFPYKPPEIVLRNLHGLKSDIYCLGAVVWFLSIGYTPFYKSGEKHMVLFKKFLHGKVRLTFQESASINLRDFVIQAMCLNPERRPTAEELLRHPFIRENEEL